MREGVMDASPRSKIVYVLPVYDPATASHFYHLYELLERAREALDIFLVVERLGASVSYDREKLMHRQFRCPSRVQRFSFPPLRFLELVFVLVGQRLRNRRFFYVHYSFYGALAAWMVTRLCGGTVYYWNSGEPWRYRRPWFTEIIFRFILRHTILVTDPPTLAEEYRHRYGLRPERIRIVPHFVSVERFSKGPLRDEARRMLGIPRGTNVVLFVHRLSRRKGAHLLPEIIAEVTRQRKDVIFVIVGDGPESASLKFKVQSLKLTQAVRLVGEVPQRDIAPYFRAADVFLLPSEEEGFPHVLLEAMATGLLYVATDVGGVREITPPVLRQFIVPSGDVSGLAVNIPQLLNFDPRTREAFIHEAGEWVSHYDLRAVMSKFVELFR